MSYGSLSYSMLKVKGKNAFFDFFPDKNLQTDTSLRYVLAVLLKIFKRNVLNAA